MAAVLSPHRFPVAAEPRPRLHLVPAAGPAARRGASTGRAAVVAVVCLLVLVVGAVLALGRGAFAGLAPAPPAGATAVPATPSGAPAAEAVVVRPGDTLWSIARRLQPTGDVRALVDDLVAANGSATVVAGDRVVVPR